jgi:putative DNA primase/helicase
MFSAKEIASHYGLVPSGDSYAGDCPSCNYQGFSLTEKKNGRVLFYCNAGGCTQQQVINALREAGLWGASPEEAPFKPLDDEPPKSEPEREQETPENKNAALAMWRRSRTAKGTVVETYLRARRYGGPIPLSLLFLMGTHPSDGAIHPIMVASVLRFIDPVDLIGVHRTFLLSDGSGKAKIGPTKMSLGPIRGGGVPLGRIEDAIAVSEGIETGLSVQQATGIPTIAALSAAGMQALLLPSKVRKVWIAADPDEVGMKAAQAAARRWHDEGRTVHIVRPPAGKDFNDLAREGS